MGLLLGLGLFSGLGLYSGHGLFLKITGLRISKRSLLTDVISGCSDLFFASNQVNFKLASLMTSGILGIDSWNYGEGPCQN